MPRRTEAIRREQVPGLARRWNDSMIRRQVGMAVFDVRMRMRRLQGDWNRRFPAKSRCKSTFINPRSLSNPQRLTRRPSPGASSGFNATIPLRMVLS